MQIKGSVIVVTGASSGIGRATAILLAHEGADVVLAARSKAIIEKLSQELPRSLAVQTDFTKKNDIDHLIEIVMHHFGRIDILINNAGRGMYGTVENIEIEKYREVFELNVVAPLYTMQKVIPVMRVQGGGMILNISSHASKAYYPHQSAYASTKYALNALSLTARRELEKENIVVGIMLPDRTKTNAVKNAVNSNMRFRGNIHLHKRDSPKHVALRIKHAIETGAAETTAH